MIQGQNQFAQNLRGLLEAQQHLAEQLAELLDRERQALESGRAEQLDEMTLRKPQVLGELEKLISQQSALLSGVGFEANSSGLQQAIQWCDPEGSLNTLHGRVGSLLTDCRTRNNQNGVLVQMRIGFVRRALQSLHGPEHIDPTYGRDGRSQLEGGGRLLGSV